MREAGHLHVRESRWLPVGVALAAMMIAPQAAAATKLDNFKALPASLPTCAVAGSGYVPPAPAITAADRTALILGGAPSALDRIRQQQASLPGSGDEAPVALRVLPMIKPVAAGLTLEPASRTSPVFGDCAPANAAIKLPARPGLMDFPVAAPAFDPDAELGTRAIAIKRTRFDDRWARVRRAAPAGLMHDKLRRAGASATLDEQELLSRVNGWVNGEIAYVSDQRNYGQSDVWATAEQTLARRQGDCEDFAILKMQMLRAAGVPTSKMKLVLLRDLAANADHAILLVQTKHGKYVLDNTTDRVYDGSRGDAVRPVLSFSDNKRWVHAYRGPAAAPVMAAQQPAITEPAEQARPVTVALADNQRSVSAELLTFKTGLSR